MTAGEGTSEDRMDWRTKIVANPRSIEARGVSQEVHAFTCAGEQASERFRTLEAQAMELWLW